LRTHKIIQVFEHERLRIGTEGFQKKHMEALVKLNEVNGFQYFDPGYNGIKFKHFVGVIQVDGLCIEILPKADKNNNKDLWRGVLIQMLKTCGRLKPESAGGANVNRQYFNLLEVYFDLYLTELEKLIRLGLVKQYRYQTGQVKAFKGKIEFAGQIRHNLIHHERFFTTHQIYDKDHKIHQVLFKALGLIGQFTRGTWLYDKYKRVALNFPEVKDIAVTASVLDSISTNRKLVPYTYPFEIARLILLSYSPDISGGNEKMLAILFNMNQLWEEYVLGMLRKHLQGSSFTVTGQEKKRFWNYNYLQPDVVIRNTATQEIFILDTKWKLPGSTSASMNDLRQIYAYNRFWKAEKAILLYPGEPRLNDFMPFLDNAPSHHCKMEFAMVVKNGKLNDRLGEEIINALGIRYVLG
jgi:5-methylcytosine-specific restriction enzyme subunit McrC